MVVTCDPDDVGKFFVARPCCVAEVLSPATEATDRREKLMAYRGIPTLRTYLIVSSDERRVVRHWRDDQSARQWDTIVGDGSIQVPCPETELSLASIYQGVDFSTS